jgi:hypothetical protein
VSLSDAPLWLQLALTAEALALAWLTARHGRSGFGLGLLASVAFWFLLAAAASFLVGRLEGGRAADASGVLQGALAGFGRLAAVAWPLAAAGALVGAVVRVWGRRRSRRRGQA